MNTCHLIQGETTNDFVIFGWENPIILLDDDLYNRIISKVETFKRFAEQNDDVLSIITRGEPVLAVDDLDDEIFERIVDEQHLILQKDKTLTRITELYDEIEYAYYMERHGKEISAIVTLRIIMENEIAAFFEIYNEADKK